MNIVVYIDEQSFLSILIASIEAFPSKYEGSKKPKGVLPEGEVYGLLFGQKMRKAADMIYNVTVAVPMQIIEYRRDGEVTPSIRHINRIKSILEAFPMLHFLGKFHSHPYKSDEVPEKTTTRPSAQDEERALYDAKINKNEIVEIILEITHLTKKMQSDPKYMAMNLIRNHCMNYKYTLGAYITDLRRKQLREVDNLICPLCAGISNADLTP